MLSVLIPTLNEARNLGDCLASVRWADQLVVVDSGSTDQTVAIAEKNGASVVQFNWNGALPRKKNWALEHVPWNHDWVLVLDADERVTPRLAREITGELKAPRAEGYFINRRFMFMGRWIAHCGYYPSWNLRLFRHRLGRYERFHDGDTASGDNEVHEHLLLRGRTSRLENELLHYAYPDLYTWVEKHNRYSNWEACVETGSNRRPSEPGDLGEPLARRRQLRMWSRKLPCRPALRFLYAYVFQRGFLDGYEGYTLCRLLAFYEYLSVLKKRELLRSGAVRWAPRR